MPDLVEMFRQKTKAVMEAIDRKGGVRGTIQSLRRQMAEADRRRAIGKAKAELKRLDSQITEMITAVGVQAVGLHQAGKLTSVELQPLCEHVVQLKAALAEQKVELARLTATSSEGAPTDEEVAVCAGCGAQLRPQARFCQKCGRPTESRNPQT